MHTSKLLGLVVVFLLVVTGFLVITPLAYAANCPSPYTVQTGEVWPLIAYRCNVKYPDLRAANPGMGDTLNAGDVLIIPGIPTSTPTATPTSTPTATNTPTSTPTKTATPRPTITPTSRPTAVTVSVNRAARSSTAFMYDVQQDDNWNKVARKYGMTVDELYSYNSFLLELAEQNWGNSTRLELTDEILIPGIHGETIIPRGSVYTIKPGQGWDYVAKLSGLSILTLKAANTDLVRSSGYLYVGDNMVVPLNNLPPVVSQSGLRPSNQGRYEAPYMNITIDGDLGDWNPYSQQPVPYMVLGTGELSADFQVGWNWEGLLIGVSVMDDFFSLPASISQNYRGDSIEILLDTNLSGDFARSTNSSDDYQIVVDLNRNAYRYYPNNQQGSVQVDASFLFDTGYYYGEIIIPWDALGISREVVDSGLTFGFSLAISDSDTFIPQQTRMIATSPARTSPTNPTQWGTLTLGR